MDTLIYGYNNKCPPSPNCLPVMFFYYDIRHLVTQLKQMNEKGEYFYQP